MLAKIDKSFVSLKLPLKLEVAIYVWQKKSVTVAMAFGPDKLAT